MDNHIKSAPERTSIDETSNTSTPKRKHTQRTPTHRETNKANPSLSGQKQKL